MREHFTTIKNSKDFYYKCPDETGCTAGFREEDHKLICETCEEEIHNEAITKKVVEDNRK